MTRKILAISLILASNIGVATGVTPPNWGTLFEKWEAPVLVLISLALQVILALLANRRKRTNNVGITIIIWSAYMAADSVATLALGVISTNLHDALKFPGSLDASIELATFWAPFLLVHLGGQDTITAYALQDTELWLRHFSNLIVETGTALYIFFGVMKRSRLSTLSAMMLVAGVIKYGERTLCLWFASYGRRRSQAVKDYDRSTHLAQSDRDQAQPDQSDDDNVENELDEELLATKMFHKTEPMFADVVLRDNGKSYSKRIVQTKSSSVVSKLITMELELMYENLYTKEKVTHSWWGFAFRLISFLLTLITLILFSRLHHRYNYSTFQLHVTYLLLGVAILLEGCAAFVFLTSYRTISWLRKHGMYSESQTMRCLSSLRTRGWSNSMGQYSMVNKYVGPKPMDPFSSIMRKPKWRPYVYERQVKDYVKEGIHEYLKEAEAKYEGGQFSIVNSRGRVPLTTWKEQYREGHPGRDVDDPITWLNFDMEFGEMVTLWYTVTEVCYYLDYDFLNGEKGYTNPSKVYRDWKMSKYLSRYLMQLYLVSSDILPPRGPFSEMKLLNYWREPTDYNGNNNRGETSNQQKKKKERRKRDRVEWCRDRRGYVLKVRLEDVPGPYVTVLRLMKALLVEDEEDPGANASKCEQLWKLLNDVWIELLINLANQCRGNQHAQHLRKGGEFLTHVWVLLGHFGLIEPW